MDDAAQRPQRHYRVDLRSYAISREVGQWRSQKSLASAYSVSEREFTVAFVTGFGLVRESCWSPPTTGGGGASRAGASRVRECWFAPSLRWHSSAHNRSGPVMCLASFTSGQQSRICSSFQEAANFSSLIRAMASWLSALNSSTDSMRSLSAVLLEPCRVVRPATAVIS